MFGAIGLIATAGSFCLFCGNGDGGLPTVTRVSPPCVASPAGTTSTATATATAAASDRVQGRFISTPFLGNRARSLVAKAEGCWPFEDSLRVAASPMRFVRAHVRLPGAWARVRGGLCGGPVVGA